MVNKPSARVLFKTTESLRAAEAQSRLAVPTQAPTIEINEQTTATPLARLAPSKAPTIEEAPDAQLIAEVNGIVISRHTLELILDADRAVAQLLHAPVGSDRNAALERVINDALVQQAAKAAGAELAPATVEQRLQTFLRVNHKSDVDLDQALTQVGLERSEFEAYFANLLLVDTFVSAQAQQLGLTAAAYIGQLQQAAHISFGPAAALVFTASAAEQVAVKTAATAPAEAATTPDLTAPAFTLPTLNTADATPLTLNSLRGHPTVLSFWTTWCPYCRRQIPILAAAQSAYRAQGVQFVGINVKDQPEAIQTYLAENPITYPLASDADGRVAGAYQVTGFPTTYFLDAQGRVVARQVGALTEEKLTEYLQKIMHSSN